MRFFTDYAIGSNPGLGMQSAITLLIDASLFTLNLSFLFTLSRPDSSTLFKIVGPGLTNHIYGPCMATELMSTLSTT